MSLTSAQNFLERMKTDFVFMSAHNNAKSAVERDAMIEAGGYKFSDEELSLALDIMMNELNATRYRKSA